MLLEYIHICSSLKNWWKTRNIKGSSTLIIVGSSKCFMDLQRAFVLLYYGAKMEHTTFLLRMGFQTPSLNVLQ